VKTTAVKTEQVSRLAAALFFSLLSLLASLSAPLAIAGKHDVAVALAIANLELQWTNAQKIAKPEIVAPMLAEGFVNTDADGQTYGKDRLLSDIKGGSWEENGISDVKVTVYGNTAVATGAWAGKGVDGDGTKIDRHERRTDTWVKLSGGKWQCVASQQTAVK
jgi:ketosteroid isomerase-like protein